MTNFPLNFGVAPFNYVTTSIPETFFINGGTFLKSLDENFRNRAFQHQTFPLSQTP